jgi:outer membrane protein assembly factor BamB
MIKTEFRQINTDPAANNHGLRRLVNCLPIFAGIAACLFALSTPIRAASADESWPQWRGPRANGIAPEANPPVTWSETENIKWKVSIPGRGSATPLIWGKQVFVQTAIPTGKEGTPPAPAPAAGAATGGEESAVRPGGRGNRPGGGSRPSEIHQFVLLCLDRDTGKVLWQQVAREEVPHEGHHRADGTFASSSPVTDGEHVWAYFGSRGLHCYDMAGKLKWSQDFGQKTIAMTFGEGSSPALHKDTIVVNWDHEGDSFIVALDKATGKTQWRKSRDERTSWATPLILEHQGRSQVIVPATRRIMSYNLATGDVLWETGGLTSNVIPSPVAGDDVVYCMSGFRGNALLAIRLDAAGDISGTDAITWRHNRSTPYVPSPLLHENRLYFFASNNAILSCLDAKTGRPLFDAERLDALQGVYASPIAAAGRIYMVGRNGATVVIKSAPALEVLATNRLEEKIDASPAVAGRELYLRGQEFLYCISEE